MASLTCSTFVSLLESYLPQTPVLSLRLGESPLPSLLLPPLLLLVVLMVLVVARFPWDQWTGELVNWEYMRLTLLCWIARGVLGGLPLVPCKSRILTMPRSGDTRQALPGTRAKSKPTHARKRELRVPPFPPPLNP